MLRFLGSIAPTLLQQLSEFLPAKKNEPESVTRSYTWFFSLAARVRCPHPISFVDPSIFSNILNSDRCKRIQYEKLHAAEDTSIISFSINTDAASVFHVDTVPVAHIIGYISTKKQMWNNVVLEWLQHPDVFNLELVSIANRRKNMQRSSYSWMIVS